MSVTKNIIIFALLATVILSQTATKAKKTDTGVKAHKVAHKTKSHVKPSVKVTHKKVVAKKVVAKKVAKKVKAHVKKSTKKAAAKPAHPKPELNFEDKFLVHLNLGRKYPQAVANAIAMKQILHRSKSQDQYTTIKAFNRVFVLNHMKSLKTVTRNGKLDNIATAMAKKMTSVKRALTQKESVAILGGVHANYECLYNFDKKNLSVLRMITHRRRTFNLFVGDKVSAFGMGINGPSICFATAEMTTIALKQSGDYKKLLAQYAAKAEAAVKRLSKGREVVRVVKNTIILDDGHHTAKHTLKKKVAGKKIHHKKIVVHKKKVSKKQKRAAKKAVKKAKVALKKQKKAQRKQKAVAKKVKLVVHKLIIIKKKIAAAKKSKKSKKQIKKLIKKMKSAKKIVRKQKKVLKKAKKIVRKQKKIAKKQKRIAKKIVHKKAHTTHKKIVKVTRKVKKILKKKAAKAHKKAKVLQKKAKSIKHKVTVMITKITIIKKALAAAKKSKKSKKQIKKLLKKNKKS